MKIHLSADYQSEIWFYPAYTMNGQLTAVELVSQFVHESAPITLPQDLLLPQLSDAQQLRLLQSQISLLEQNYAFFDQHNVKASMRIDHNMSVTLLESEFLTRKVKQLPFLLLDISETFPQLSQGINNPLLASLKHEFKLSLSQFGAGKSPSNAIYDNLFTCIKLDKQFVHSLAKRASFQPFIQSIVDNFHSHCEQMIICGIDDDLMLNKIAFLPGLHIQGALFPVVKSDALDSLICADSCAPPSLHPH